MFCPNCGTDCREARFCPECGTDLREWNGAGGAAPSDVGGIAEFAAAFDIPIGRYDGTFGYVELREAEMLVHKKVLFKTMETAIPYTDIAAVAYQKAEGLGSDFLSVRSRQERFVPLADGSNAAGDKTALVFGSQANVPMFQVYQCLHAFAERNRIDCTAADIPDQMVSSGAETPALSEGEPDVDACPVDMGEYFARFNPNRVAAVKAIVQETGLDMRQAKELVDREFAHRQKTLYAAQPDAAMRDLKRALNPKKAERDERRAELDKQGVVYCPKCLSTSISANQKGFGFVRGALGASVGLDVGMIAGGIGAKKVRCTCLKCGYQWIAGKK